MSSTNHRLSRPVYEGLPWLYLLGGLLALIASYFQTSSTLSVVLGLPGFAGTDGRSRGIAAAPGLPATARPVRCA